MKLPLLIDEIEIAYNAVDNAPHLDLIKQPILEKLDVEEFKEEYTIEFENAEFENLRVAVCSVSPAGPEVLAFAEKLKAIRRTLL